MASKSKQKMKNIIYIFILISFVFGCKEFKTIVYRGNEIAINAKYEKKLLFLIDTLYAIDSLKKPSNKRWKYMIVSPDIISKDGDGLWSYLYYTTYSSIYRPRYLLVSNKNLFFNKEDSIIDIDNYQKFYSLQKANFSKRKMKKIKELFVKNKPDSGMWSTEIRR